MTLSVDTIPVDLERAYREALYIVHAKDKNIHLKVGDSSSEMVELMRLHDVKSAALITAFNPRSILATAEENVRNHNALVADINALGLESLSGEGGDVSNAWPSEPSVLALGISLQDAELLADRYRQNAFLWIAGDDGLVRLNLRYPIEGLSE